jgi:hypothetical protein
MREFLVQKREMAKSTMMRLSQWAPVGSISEIRAKLHAKIASFKKGRKAEDDAGSKDELLEMRRQQRAAMRERRRKETKEKKQKEKEEKKKGKGRAPRGILARCVKPSSIRSGLIPNMFM